jgi:hypothetical protein
MKRTFALFALVISLAATAFASPDCYRNVFAAQGQGNSTQGIAYEQMNPQDPFDAAMLQEQQIINSILKLNTQLVWCFEMNAFAHPAGVIFYGKPFAGMFLQKYGETGGVVAILLVLAHENGHQYQFAMRGPSNPSPQLELEADFLAGVYLGVRIPEGNEQMFEMALQVAYDMGDYEVNNPLHHGTPDQRRAALLEGIRKGIEIRGQYSAWAALAF